MVRWTHYVWGGWHCMAGIQFVKKFSLTPVDTSSTCNEQSGSKKQWVDFLVGATWLVEPSNLPLTLPFASHCGSPCRSPEVPTGCSPEPLRNRVQSRLDLLKPKVMWAPSSKSPKSKPSVTSNWIRCTNMENNVFTSCNFSLVLYYLFS